MTEVIDTLIDKQDSFEIVRDQLAVILVTEVANQRAKATGAGKDSALWNLRVFTERSNPVEEWLNVEPATDLSPIINIWVDNGAYPGGKGSTFERQIGEVIYNIDCYGVAVSGTDGAGHKLADKEAAFEAQRAVRLVRNIFMAAINDKLQLSGTVGKRWPQGISFFQPQINNVAVQHIVGGRVALQVTMKELAPQITPTTLDEILVNVKRLDTGQIVLEADYIV